MHTEKKLNRKEKGKALVHGYNFFFFFWDKVHGYKPNLVGNFICPAQFLYVLIIHYLMILFTLQLFQEMQ